MYSADQPLEGPSLDAFNPNGLSPNSQYSPPDCMLLDMSSSPSPKAISPQIQINSPEVMLPQPKSEVMLPQPKSEVMLPQPKSEVQPKSARLPCPCPLPSTFSPCLKKAISDNKLEGNKKLLLIREACTMGYVHFQHLRNMK